MCGGGPCYNISVGEAHCTTQSSFLPFSTAGGWETVLEWLFLLTIFAPGLRLSSKLIALRLASTAAGTSYDASLLSEPSGDRVRGLMMSEKWRRGRGGGVEADGRRKGSARRGEGGR